MMNDKWLHLKEKIENSSRIFLSTHINPDGDGLGSEVAFYSYLKMLNKDCKIINISPIEDNYKFLNIDNVIECYDPGIHDSYIENSDLAIIFDIGDYRRLGNISSLISVNDIYTISIDHHPSDDEFFNFKILNVKAPATGYMVWEYLKFLNINKFEGIMGDGLYTALITDTGSFRYNSTDSDSHIMASELLSSGVKPYDVYSNIYEQRTVEQISLLSRAISLIEFSKNNEFAWVCISQKDFLETNSRPADVEGFTDFIRSIKNVEVSFVLIELKSGNIKLSLRSRGKYIINDIAHKFDGGGHLLAAGATCENMSFNKVVKIILQELNKKRTNVN